MHVDQVRTSLTGPIASLRTPFTREGEIDHAGLRRLIDLSLNAGCGTSLLTAGDSHFACMSDQEIAEVTKTVVEHTARRAMVVAADWEFGTPQAVAFARFCRDLGVDVLMTRPPDWANSATVESLVGHYRAVAAVIPVMVVTNIFNQRNEKFSMNVLQRLLDVPNIVALKEDLQNDFARKVSLLVHDRWAVFAGGGLRNHLNMHPYGCDGFMCRFMSFKPQVSRRYWDAICRNDWKEAVEVIRTIELPLERHWNDFPGGRDAAVHGVMEIYGLCGRWRKPPYYNVTDAELEQLRGHVREVGLL